MIETNIVASGIIDYFIEQLRKKAFGELTKSAEAINIFINRWINAIAP